MVKKLLTLSLVAVMLSVTALASPGGVMLMDATYAEEAEEVPETFDNTKYEILMVQQATETTQKITKPTSNVGAGTTSRWYLVKVDIGKDWGSFTSIVSKFRILAVKGKNYSYLTSLTKADYDDAFVAVETTVDNFLTEPRLATVNNEYMWKDGSGFSGDTSNQTLTLNLSEGRYTYSDGCLYFAFQCTSDNATNPYAGIRVADTSFFVTTVTGTKVEVPVVDNFSDAEIDWNDGTYTVTTATTSGTAMLVVAFFDGTTMVDAEVETVDAAEAQNGVISGTIENLEEGTSVKLFLWDSETLAPLVNSVEKAVTSTPPAAPATWSGVAATEEPSIVDGYYQIETGEDLAWFAAQVNAGNTAYKAKLMNDIYLNWFDDDSNGVFDENWYETEANVAEATSWNDYKIAGFTGEFDGNDKTIYGLYMEGGSGTGFFTEIKTTAIVKDVNFSSPLLISTLGASSNAQTFAIVTGGVSKTADASGAEVGKAIIDDVDIIKGKIKTTSDGSLNNAGGIAGHVTATTDITNCDVELDMDATGGVTTTKNSGSHGVGAIIGSTTSGATNITVTVSACSFNGNIYAPYTQNVGALVGMVYSATTGYSNHVIVKDSSISGSLTSLPPSNTDYSRQPTVGYKGSSASRANLEISNITGTDTFTVTHQ